MAVRRAVWFYLFAAGLMLVAGAQRVFAAEDASEGKSEKTFFRIGTSPVGESHFLIGGALANALSNPAGSRECEKGGSCGVPGLIVAAQASSGSVENIERLRNGTLEAAFLQSDLAAEAFESRDAFEGLPAFDSLRLLGLLYYDSVQIVTRRESGIEALEDLRGKRIAIGEDGSDVHHSALTILAATGIGAEDAHYQSMPLDQAVAALAEAELDAVFVVDGYPAQALSHMDERVAFSLVPIPPLAAGAIRVEDPFFLNGLLPAGVYSRIDRPVETVRIGVYLFTTKKMSETLACNLVRALHHPATRAILTRTHWRGKEAFPVDETPFLPVPWHAGLADCRLEN